MSLEDKTSSDRLVSLREFMLHIEGVSYNTLVSLTSDLIPDTFSGLSHRPTKLYYERKIEEAVRDYLLLPHVDPKTGLLTDEDGTIWIGYSNIRGLYRSMSDEVEAALAILAEIKIARARSGQRVVLYRVADVEGIYKSLGYDINALKKSSEVSSIFDYIDASPNTPILTLLKMGQKRISWSALVSTPEDMTRLLELVAHKLINEGFKLSVGNIADKNGTSFINAVRKHYPGGLIALQDKLQIIREYKPRNHYRNVEVILQLAREIVLKHGDISHTLLINIGLSGLADAIREFYPGGWEALAKELAIDAPKRQNYWTIEIILKEAREIVLKHGYLSTRLLDSLSRKDLKAQIHRKYPGSIKALRCDLRTQAQPSARVTIDEAAAILQQLARMGED